MKMTVRNYGSIHPLDPNEHTENIINVAMGRIAPDNVNVDKALSIGKMQKEEFESTFPEGFHKTISNKVVTMSTLKKHINVGKTLVYDTNLIYSRVIRLQSARDMSMKGH